MRCKSEFITGERKHDDRTNFAAFVRNLTPTALSLTVPFGTLDRMAQMPKDAHLVLRERNRQRYAVSPATTSASAAADSSESIRLPDADDENWSSGTRST